MKGIYGNIKAPSGASYSKYVPCHPDTAACAYAKHGVTIMGPHWHDTNDYWFLI
jgi:hypothetical protein